MTAPRRNRDERRPRARTRAAPHHRRARTRRKRRAPHAPPHARARSSRVLTLAIVALVAAAGLRHAHRQPHVAQLRARAHRARTHRAARRHAAARRTHRAPAVARPPRRARRASSSCTTRTSTPSCASPNPNRSRTRPGWRSSRGLARNNGGACVCARRTGAGEGIARRGRRAGDVAGVRLGDVQIRQGPRLARTALMQHDETVESFAKRGAILDRDGGVLVRSLPSESIYAVPTEVVDPHAAALKLAPLLRKPAARSRSGAARPVAVPLARAQGAARRRRARARARLRRHRHEGRRDRRAFRRVGPARVDGRRLHRHRRERSGRPRVLARHAAARHARQSADRSRSVRPRDPVRQHARRRTRGRRQDHRHDARPVPAVRERTAAARGGEEVERAQRHGDRDGPVDRRTARGRERPRLRARALRRVPARRVARPRDQRRVRAGLDVQADHRRRRRSRAASSRPRRAFRRATRCKSAAARSTTPRTA